MAESTWEEWDQPETITRGEAVERLRAMSAAERHRADHLWAALATTGTRAGLSGSALPQVHNPFWCWDVGLADLAELPSETIIVCGVTISHADLRPRLSWRIRIPIPEKDGQPFRSGHGHTDAQAPRLRPRTRARVSRRHAADLRRRRASSRPEPPRTAPVKRTDHRGSS